MPRRMLLFLVVSLGVARAGSAAVAQSPSPVPDPSGGRADTAARFVLPEGGYALTFPEGWVVEVHPLDYSPIPVVTAREPGEGSDCWVRVAGPCGGPCSDVIDAQAARELAWWSSGEDVEVPSTVASETMTLAAGDAVRVDVEYVDREWDRSYYWLTDGRVLATLGCQATRGPDDHWLPIAETFEFLPADE